MMLKTDIPGVLLTLQAIVALMAAVLPQRFAVVSRHLWRSVILLSAAVIAMRWLTVMHPPMRNLYEAFLWIPPLLALTTEVSRRHGVGTVRLDATLGFIVAFPLAFVFSDAVSPLPAALQSGYFVPHVLGYMLAYALLARAFVLECLAAVQCRNGGEASVYVKDSRINAAFGFLLLTTSLALGSLWGNTAWGAYWQWDPKEQWSLATWLVYAAYFHTCGRPRWRLTLLGIGLAAIVLTVTWINLSKLFPGMHTYAGF